MHTIMVKNNNDVVGCGSNDHGQLGLGNNNFRYCQPITIMKGIPIQQITIGIDHTVILGEDNNVFVFGDNAFGQLGLGHNECEYSPIRLMDKISQIACGNFHTVIVRDNRDVLVFGNNAFGQLGLGNYDHQNKPIVLMQGILIREIACGGRHTVILKENNDVLVFGYNGHGQLGLGHNVRKNKPVLLMNDRFIRQIACGGDHTMILTEDNDVFVFGNNNHGQLGIGKTDNQNKPIKLMIDVSKNISPICQIACGNTHTVILKENSEVLVFGDNRSGQLGLDNDENEDEVEIKDLYQPMILMKDVLIRQIACGHDHTMILKENNKVLVFGCDDYGQLGLAYPHIVNTPTLLMKNVKKLQGNQPNIKWNPENHYRFSNKFKNSILYFLFVHKRNQINTGLKIPKFVLFEIFKQV